MKKSAFVFFFLFISNIATSQPGFQFEPYNKRKVSIPFQLINNLIFIPLNVNGVELTFLLDSGVDETILFSLDDKEDVSFLNVKKIMLRGLGTLESIEGLKSSDNTLSVPGFIDRQHDIYIVLDQSFNFSSSIGIPVNGIIGYHFFKNHLVEIDYKKKQVVVFNDDAKLRKKIDKKYKSFDISIEKNKPYTFSEITIEEKTIPAKLLIDSGSSDALWLFKNKSHDIPIPGKSFSDFLGRGFSGDVQGQRARVNTINFESYTFSNIIAAFPDSTATQGIVMVEDRIGSIGGEILKRFDMIFDYKGGRIYLRKNRDFDLPFHYNMSGIEVHHSGMTWVKEAVELNTTVAPDNTYDVNGNKIPNSFTYKFELKPLYSISSIRKDSPADVCGLKKGDIIVSINRKPGYRFTLQQINALLKSEEGRVINIEIEREGINMKFQFQLKSIL